MLKNGTRMTRIPVGTRIYADLLLGDQGKSAEIQPTILHPAHRCHLTEALVHEYG